MGTSKFTVYSIAALTFLLLPNIRGNAQLKVDAGNDTTYCVGMYGDTMYLAPDLRIENAIGSYSVRWECEFKLTETLIFTASDILNDTTLLSPLIKEPLTWPDWLQFTVHVTDSANNYTKDNINVRFSTFAYLLGYSVLEVKKGDSILFKYSNIGKGIDPLSYSWIPKTGLSNPDSLITWCKPDTSTRYYSVAIDSCGCVSEPNLRYDIRVMPTGVKGLNLNSNNLLNIRQNGTKLYFNNPHKQKARITLYSINGGEKYQFSIVDDNLEIARLLKAKGIYIVNISVGKYSGSGKFIN